MEEYASKDATITALESLGFTLTPLQDGREPIALNSPKKTATGLPVLQLTVYQCRAGYWCVDLEGGYQAPCVWNGPKAEWDKTDTLTDFVAWLDRNHNGWR